ncbi:DUF2383 domain-containing protein [uncultured Algibacter sp.]|uniref:DUF2383 domain-containing protein n=1 Tax=uncultured Algibacter sp. TaxID=298659 RepID=UPI00262282A5|nr:DUF2383 domain-containing protein [uncultured Algibacter sp.]
MKGSNNFLSKLNELIIMNEEVEKTYKKIQKNTSNEEFIPFFKDKIEVRNQFGQLLLKEVNKLGDKEQESIMLNRRNKLIRSSFKKSLQINDELNLQNEVYRIEQFSVEKYNELLMEMNLPLKLCKLLIRQRDIIQYTSRLIERGEAFVV